jgi:hypothetical protein
MVVLAGAVLATACGSAGGDGGDAATGGGDLRAAAVRVSQCMREKGYDMPDPTFDGDDTPRFEEPGHLRGDAAYEAARAECRKPFNEAWLAAGKPNRKAEGGENMLAFARCVRERGINVPDPDPNGGWTLDKQLTQSPAWQEAAQACRHHLPDAAGVPGLTSKQPTGPEGGK